MNIRLFGTLFCVMCAIYPMVCGAAATYVHVPDGATVSIDGKRNTTFTVNGSSVKNHSDTILVADGDATIAVTYPSTTSGGLYCGFIATNGTVTLDLTAISGCDFVLDNGACVKGDGVLRVKGRDSVCLGTTYGVVAPADAVNLEYVDASGVPYAEPEGLVLTNQFIEWNLPTTTSWHLSSGAKPYISRENSAIAALLMDNGTLTIGNGIELWVLNVAALPSPSTPIAVGSGSALVVMPRAVTESAYYTLAGIRNMTVTNAISIAAGGELNLRSHYILNMNGAISGGGTIRFTATKDDQNGTNTIANASAFTGAVSCETAGNTLAFQSASPGAGGNDVTLLEGCVLCLGTTETDGYSGSVGVLTGPSTGSATLAILASCTGTVAIASRTGNVTITGAGYDKTTVVLGSIKEGETVVADGGTFKYELGPAALSSSGVFSITRTNGRNVYMRSADASSVDFGKFDIPASGTYSLAAASGVTYQNVPENVCLEVGSGVSAALAAQTNVETRVRMAGGSLDVSRYVPEFASKVLYWMDPSNRASVESDRERTLNRVLYPEVSGMNDTRSGQTSLKLSCYSATDSTWPTLITNGVNGLDYLSCDTGGNRRLWFGNFTGISPAFAIMVFGSQFGGGQAIIGNSSGYYCRGGTLNQSITKDNPIFATNGISTWVNGVAVDATATNLSGGWEIISFDTSAAVVHGLGFNAAPGTPANTRGQNYGEVLLFSETPTEAERVAAEKYLAQKWGLLADYHEEEQTVPSIRAEGNGSITLNTDVAFSGSFAGTVNMNGKSLSVVDDPLPPGDEAVVSEGRLAWFDPDCTERIAINNGQVNNIYDREAGATDGAPVLNASGRSPAVLNGARGFGPSRRWVDYSQVKGRTMRLNQYPTTSGTPIVALKARTVFLVQDSLRGGGSPFLSAVGGTGDILNRLTEYPTMMPDPGLPVWRGTTANIFSSGATYLDGREIDGAVDGFQGRPELLTAVGGRDFTLGAFAYYNYLKDYTGSLPFAGEIQGEIIVYDCALGEADRKGVEAYLMWKWLGTARAGYSVMTNVTVSGEGRLNVESFAQMPKIGASFTGTLALSETSFDFTVTAAGAVQGALSDISGTLELPASCTANVTLGQGVPAGEYALISGAITSGTDWTLNLVAPTPGYVSLEVRGGVPLLVVRKKGVVFSFR